MPATNYNWPLNDQSHIFQVYGTKRKNCSEESSQDVVEFVETKRRCTESRVEEDMHMADPMDCVPHPHGTSPFGFACTNNNMSDTSQPPMHSNAGIQHLAQHNLQVTMNNRVPPLPDPTGDHFMSSSSSSLQPVPSSGQEPEMNNNDINPQTFNQNEMLMDLHDGVYSSATLRLNPQTDAEYEAACAVASMEAEGTPNPHQSTMSYCDQFCVGGNLSPSGKVRCLCKPSWEGLMDMRPYVSDYY